MGPRRGHIAAWGVLRAGAGGHDRIGFTHGAARHHIIPISTIIGGFRRISQIGHDHSEAGIRVTQKAKVVGRVTIVM
jgi:hypothetical protein